MAKLIAGRSCGNMAIYTYVHVCTYMCLYIFVYVQVGRLGCLAILNFDEMALAARVYIYVCVYIYIIYIYMHIYT